jgi:MFS family permease
MSAARTSALLVRLYPAQWRDRYGEELAGLILETSGGNVSWRIRLDVAAAAVREHGRSLLAWRDGSPRETISSALATVLWAWALVVVGGCIVAKSSEHWRTATPVGSRPLPGDAFQILVGGAIGGTAVVVAGAALALPAVARRLRAGQRGRMRRPFALAAGSTVALVFATIGLSLWAHRLTSVQRNGHDVAYGAAFVAWVVLFVFCVAAWTWLGARLARDADLGEALLRIEAVLAGAAAVAMGVIASAGVLWWVAVAQAAPWFFSGGARGSSGTGVTGPLVVAGLLMMTGTLLAGGSSVRALRAARFLPSGERR